MGTQIVSLQNWLEKRARLCEKEKLYKEAVFYWERVLQVLTRSVASEDVDVVRLAAVHYRLGQVHRLIKDPTKSLYHLKHSVRLNSSEPRYFQAFGKAFLSGGHLKVAKAQFEKAIELDPKNTNYIRQYAQVLLMLGKKDKAYSSARKAFEMKPDLKENRMILARIFIESDMFIPALSVLDGIKKKSERTLDLIDDCTEKLYTTFEGSVLKMLRKGMKCDGKPFTVKHLKEAESIWVDYCLHRKFGDKWDAMPNVWAAASALYVTYLEETASFEFDEILERFQVSSIEVWPYLKKFQLPADIKTA
jgi:tetratricopeptide (TPR) repeat protein